MDLTVTLWVEKNTIQYWWGFPEGLRGSLNESQPVMSCPSVLVDTQRLPVVIVTPSFSVCFPQVLWDTMSIQVHVNTSIVVWGVTVWSTMRLSKGSVSAWTTANRTINQCAVPMGSCTRTTVSFTGPPVSGDTGLPSCTARSASTKVRAHVTFL